MTVQNPMMQALLDLLSRDPKATYPECRDALGAQGFELYPVSYGRALVLAGIVPNSPRGMSKHYEQHKRRAAGCPRPTGRPRKDANAGASAPANQRVGRPSIPGKVSVAIAIDGLKAKILHLTCERDQARQALRQIRELAR